MTNRFPCPEFGARAQPAAVDLDWQSGRVSVSGELDAYTAPGFVASFTQDVEVVTGGSVTMDCSSLRFVDASGLSALIVAARHTRSTGIGFHVADAGRRLTRLMDVCSLREL